MVYIGLGSGQQRKSPMQLRSIMIISGVGRNPVQKWHTFTLQRFDAFSVRDRVVLTSAKEFECRCSVGMRPVSSANRNIIENWQSSLHSPLKIPWCIHSWPNKENSDILRYAAKKQAPRFIPKWHIIEGFERLWLPPAQVLDSSKTDLPTSSILISLLPSVPSMAFALRFWWRKIWRSSAAKARQESVWIHSAGINSAWRTAWFPTWVNWSRKKHCWPHQLITMLFIRFWSRN